MTIDQRLSKLERSCRRWRCVSLASILVVAGVAASGAAKPNQIPDVVRARAFHVVGNLGKVLVKLEDTGGFGVGLAGTVTTLNGRGQKLIRLAMTANGEGMVTTLNSKGHRLVQLAATTHGTGGITTLNRNGHKLVELTETTYGTGAVVTLNGKGQELVEIGGVKGGNGGIRILNGRGQDVVQLAASVGGANGVITTLNSKGHRLVQLAATTDSTGVVEVFEPTGRKRRGLLSPRRQRQAGGDEQPGWLR